MASTKRIILTIIVLFTQLLQAQTMSVKQYIDSFKSIAMIEMLEYKIPASITLAQGLLESGSGNSRLAKQGNNHFGIKCKKDWTGCTILEDDDALQECFRCYNNAKESYKDHSKFLKENKRYAGLFSLDIMDYKGWAAGLLAAGYATNQKYTDLLISCIERNKLAQYDTMIKNGFNPYEQNVPANIEVVVKNKPHVVVQPNQTIKTIAEQNDKTEKKLAKYNDLLYHQIQPGDVLYLKPKKRKALVPEHTVKEGENMWLISQKYAIKLNSLYAKNLMDKGTEPNVGSVLHLQKKASSTPDTIKTRSKDVKINSNNLIDSNIHVVKPGETLYSISKLYFLSLQELMDLNQMHSNSITVGQKLKVKKINIEKPLSSPVNTTHTVKSGDTLYSISKLYNVDVDTIKKLNNLTSNSLQIGQILTIK